MKGSPMRRLTASQRIAQLEHRIAQLEKESSEAGDLEEILKVFEDEGYRAKLKQKKTSIVGSLKAFYILTNTKGEEADLEIALYNNGKVSIVVGSSVLAVESSLNRALRRLKKNIRDSFYRKKMSMYFI